MKIISFLFGFAYLFCYLCTRKQETITTPGNRYKNKKENER